MAATIEEKKYSKNDKNQTNDKKAKWFLNKFADLVKSKGMNPILEQGLRSNNTKSKIDLKVVN